MLPHKNIFFFHSSVLGSGSARAEPQGCTNTSLPQQPCLDGKVQWVGNVAIRNLSPPSLSGGRREPPQPHRWRIWYWGSCCWVLTTSPTPLGSNWSMPYFSTASCLEWQKTRRRCRGLFPWTPLHWVEGAACKAGLDLWLWTSGQFQSCFGLCNQKKKKWIKLVWTEKEMTHCTHLRYLDELNETSQMPDLPLLL